MIVEAHDGSVTLRSELNEGTTFTIVMPPAAPYPPSAVAGEDRALRGPLQAT